jgi:multidrug efflux system membrane fusion protein
VKPVKSDFRKSNGRFEPVEIEAAMHGDDSPAMPRPPASPPTAKGRGGPRIVLPLIVLICVAVYLDHTGSLKFWPAGTLQSRIAPYLPAVVQKILPSTGQQTPGTTPLADTSPPGPPGSGDPSSRRRNGSTPIPVLTAPVRLEDVPIIATAVGTVQALATVTVRTQVDGPLLELTFKDGQDVRKGDVLARIDARTYQAQYDQAVAKKAQDDSVLANARIDLQRYDRLATSDYGTKQQADTQRALVTQYEALVRSDQGAIDNTRAILDNCTIRSPLDGRTGIRTVDQGNVVHAADTNGIVVITQIHPISVLFNVPQQQLKAVFTAIGKGPVPTDALEADDTTVIEHGHIEVIDNQVDQTTGTIRLKATFPNAHEQLWPGQFVNVHVLVDTLKSATVVPTGAVQRGPNGAYVFVLNDDATVTQANVTIGHQDETRAVVLSGVVPPARVVTTGFTRLIDGSKVTLGAGEAATPASPTAPPGPPS